MSDTTKRKKPNMIRIGIGILTVLLVVFIVILMQLVSNIQGTARVVNYAGLIRGETQRIIKLENSGQREDELIKEVQSFIEGLRHGNDQLKLVRLKDDDFQDKMKELEGYFGRRGWQILFPYTKKFIACGRSAMSIQISFQRARDSLRSVMRQQVLRKYMHREKQRH